MRPRPHQASPFPLAPSRLQRLQRLQRLRWSLCALGVFIGGTHLESPLGTVNFLETYPDILGQRFTCSSVEGCLDPSGEHAVSLSPSPRDPREPAVLLRRWRWGVGGALMGPARESGADPPPEGEEGEDLGPAPASPGSWAPAHLGLSHLHRKLGPFGPGPLHMPAMLASPLWPPPCSVLAPLSPAHPLP